MNPQIELLESRDCPTAPYSDGLLAALQLYADAVASCVAPPPVTQADVDAAYLAAQVNYDAWHETAVAHKPLIDSGQLTYQEVEAMFTEVGVLEVTWGDSLAQARDLEGQLPVELAGDYGQQPDAGVPRAEASWERSGEEEGGGGPGEVEPAADWSNADVAAMLAQIEARQAASDAFWFGWKREHADLIYS